MTFSRRLRNRNVRLLTQENSVDGNVALADSRQASPADVQLEVERKEIAYVESGNALGEIKTKLWDAVAERWTSPLPQVTATMNLRVIVDKCSACVWTSHGVGGKKGLVGNHIRQVMQAGYDHREAEIQTVITYDGQSNRCTACEVSFRSRPIRAHSHIQEVVERGEAHHKAETIVMRRFLSEPPVVEQAAVPVAVIPTPLARESQPLEKRRRRRSRGRKAKVANV